ncbi:hypothetical protein NPIL_121011 [Nephila pilipes]|uniref:Uncharacterized protein n=1 Tax=Nephila pilipes TaxID=299642 RepID=A0A8X6MZY1_NEPPI|nr:hypothetical protein NPIL_121011 [Nephila pilipes]
MPRQNGGALPGLRVLAFRPSAANGGLLDLKKLNLVDEIRGSSRYVYKRGRIVSDLKVGKKVLSFSFYLPGSFQTRLSGDCGSRLDSASSKGIEVTEV